MRNDAVYIAMSRRMGNMLVDPISLRRLTAVFPTEDEGAGNQYSICLNVDSLINKILNGVRM